MGLSCGSPARNFSQVASPKKIVWRSVFLLGRMFLCLWECQTLSLQPVGARRGLTSPNLIYAPVSGMLLYGFRLIANSSRFAWS